MIKQLSKRNTRIYILIFSIVLIACISIIFALYLKQRDEENYLKLNATVILDNDKIIITNKDSFDYVNTKLFVNNHYELLGFNIKEGETSTLWQIEFSTYTGRKMSTKEKALTFSMVCDIYDDKKGFYNIKFN